MASPTDILIESGVPLPEEPVILVVALPNGHPGGYYINGEQKPVLTFVKGGTYIFDHNNKNEKIYLIEDCAVALGAKINNENVGVFGDYSFISFKFEFLSFIKVFIDLPLFLYSD